MSLFGILGTEGGTCSFFVCLCFIFVFVLHATTLMQTVEFLYDGPAQFTVTAPYREIQMFLVKGTQNKAMTHKELEANSSQVPRSRHKFIPKPCSSSKCLKSTIKELLHSKITEECA